MRSIILDYLSTILKLILELALFVLNLPKYLQQFLQGLRGLSQMYDATIKSLEEQVNRASNIVESDISSEDLIKKLDKFIESTRKLQKRHEEILGTYFAILLSLLAILISLIALTLNN